MKKLNEEALSVFVDYYYPRAKTLQHECNWGPHAHDSPKMSMLVNDPLMQHVPIYDTVTRNAAGFSNVLQDLWFGTDTPKWHRQADGRQRIIESYDVGSWDMETWLYVFMCHRLTGSGASFEHDHGYRNNAIQHWGSYQTIDEMAADLVRRKENGQAIFTSIGNQPAAPKKGVSNIEFMTRELPDLISDFTRWLISTNDLVSHKEIVDYLNEYNLRRGHRRFNFQYAAFAMDCSDYYPERVDEDSHTYLGNNAKRCMKLLSNGWKADEFMDMLAERTGGKPKDLEDVMCDFCRFAENYVPRRGSTFDHIPHNISNKSGWDSGWRQRTGTPSIS